MKSPRQAAMVRAAVILALVTLAAAVVAAPAQAASYRYWGYFHQAKGAWAFAQKGPAQTLPAGGTVEGWRFAVAAENPTRNPRTTPTFEALCAGTTVTTGTKRVGIVIDFGRPADSADAATPPAPRAACVTVPATATGSDVLLAAGATLRIDKALTCAIDGWPATGCGEAVAKVSAPAAGPDTPITIAVPKATAAVSLASQTAGKDSKSQTGLILGGAGAVLLVAALGFAAWRRGRDATAATDV